MVKNLARPNHNQNSEHLAQRREALSFRPKGEYPYPSPPLGMTDLGPSLGVLASAFIRFGS